MSAITRRRFLEYGAGAGAGLVLWRSGRGRAFAHEPAVGMLDPLSIPKYVTPLVIPPAMPRTSTIARRGDRSIEYYEIAVRQFRQRILPPSMGLAETTVWSYGSVNHPGSFNYPAFTIEATWRRPVRVKWINGLVKPNGEFRPHLLPIDQTLHWAESARRARTVATVTATDHAPYRGPGADRDPPPRRAQQRGVRRLSRRPGSCPTARNIPAGYAQDGLALSRRSARRRRRRSVRHGRPAAPSSSTTTTSARRRCGTTTTRSA